MAKNRSGKSSTLKTMVIASILLLAILFFVLIPLAIDRFGDDIAALLGSTTKPVFPALPPDMQHYYSLKNTSCKTLSENFMIEAADVSDGSITGLITSNPDEEAVAHTIASGYDSVQTTRTYVRGDWMKKAIITPSGNHTTIWKEGRVYQCNPGCTMDLLGDSGWQAYLDTLDRMREGCRYFGRTPLPAGVDVTRLIKIVGAGRVEMNGFRCERFSIFGNKTYADSLLASSGSSNWSDDQKALLWAVSHLEGPVEECLDDGTGVLVSRSLVLDLTPSYRFDYSPGGGMFVNQQTNVTYYSTDVPVSFFALPG
jgi:hypothetical protein